MIKVICVGKIKESFLRDALKEYQKRLTKYTKLEIIEVNDVVADTVELTQRKEKEQIERYIGMKDYVITLEIEGHAYCSTDFSKHIEELQIKHSNITFIIGGSDGLDEEIKKRANEAITFSSFTFPHQLFRVILLEQIYRAFKIMKNESYHK